MAGNGSGPLEQRVQQLEHLVQQLITTMNNHQHSGVTAGGANTGVITTATQLNG